MKESVDDILSKGQLLHNDIRLLIGSTGNTQKLLRQKASETTLANRGNKVYYRGLIEFSNNCSKDCYYCGIRKSNKEVSRYDLDDDTIIKAAKYAADKNFGSVVLQSGERSDPRFTDRIDSLLKTIKKISGNRLGITLSLGEQSRETYERWFRSGAHRYLLRIETSNEKLYKTLHPNNEEHSFEKRLVALKYLKETGYQTGSGVMIGLPGQTISHLADDLLFLKDLDIDMVGMGPYIEHQHTPLAATATPLWTLQKRFEITLNMIAVLRVMMPDINIAATTALQTIDPVGREKALKCGANIIMPNITPANIRKNYLLYDNKPCIDENADDCLSCLQLRIGITGRETGLGEWGDSLHYLKRTK